MGRVLERELKTYERERLRMLEEHKGKFVLIHKSEIAGYFTTHLEAVNEGYQRFGNVPFLVKEIVEVETPRHLITHPGDP
jgi:hypothetical protein